MTRPQSRLIALSCLALLAAGGCAAAPQPGVVTVWSHLGIPQAAHALHEGMFNRHGHFPGLEKKPPLLAIANPLNLESPNPAIKAAAEIKAEEDLARQKIKALRYLGTIGCGCYDAEGKVEAAMLAGLNDCNEDVRAAAVEAIQSVVGDVCDGACNNNCCTKAIQERLQDMAYGETDGCWHEPSAAVRQAALATLTACPPIEILDVEQREIIPQRETVPVPPPSPEVPPPPTPPASPVPPAPPIDAGAWKAAETFELDGNTVAGFTEPEIDFVSHTPTEYFAEQEELPQTKGVSLTISDDSDDQPSAGPRLLGKVVIEYVDARKGIVTMHRPSDSHVKVGQRLHVRIHSRTGDHTVEGHLEVVGVTQTLIKVKPAQGLAINTLRTGGHVTLSR